MATNSKNTRNKVIVLVLVAVIALGGFAGLLSSLLGRGQSAPAPQVTATTEPTPEVTGEPTPELTAPPVAESTALGTVLSGPTPLSNEDVAFATTALSGMVATSGSVITLAGYENFDTLTALNLESGEKLYFATSGIPFPQDFGIPAGQESRDLIEFGAVAPGDEVALAEADRILENHRAAIG